MKLSRRNIALLAGLAAAAALVIFSPPPDKDGGVVQPMAAHKAGSGASPAKRSSKSDATGTILEIHPRGKAGEIANAFAPQSWTPPPSPPPENLKPTAPLLPFSVIGKKLQDGEWQVFLANQDRVYVVKDKDVLDGVYRADSVTPPKLTLTYLPLNIQQTLAIGSADQ